MSKIIVNFTYFTGIKRQNFSNVCLGGSWDESGHYSDQWTFMPMEEEIGSDGCPCFTATVELDENQISKEFHWGVKLDSPKGQNIWGIPTEVNDIYTNICHRSFNLQPESTQPQQEEYYLTHCRRLGAQKYYLPGQTSPGIQFAVWAPNAKNVELVFGVPNNGYIADDGSGINPALGAFPLFLQEEGIWKTDWTVSPQLSDFSKFDHEPYMFRITKEGGEVAYRTDLYSRCQIGKGDIDPKGKPYSGNYTGLDGTISCSVVIDPETVTKNFKEQVWPEIEFIKDEEFWKDEFHSERIVPHRLEDLVIYELHIGALGYGKKTAGNFEDAINLLDYLVDLGVNAVEILPMSEFNNDFNWGYETSHYFSLEYSAGGRDQLKHFVRECHRRGIAVILDVVYNHYGPEAERAAWFYDSNLHENNIYYWYEGKVSDYSLPDGGYVDNNSTGRAPRFHEEMVRKLFISSAATIIEEFHIDGFRVDQTTSMHLYNRLRADNSKSLGNVNSFGAKFLRELTQTLKLIQPDVMLIAEDHSNWDKVTQATNEGGLGFDATWYADFYHHLIGDGHQGTEYAKLINVAGHGGDEPLFMDRFAGALGYSGHKKVVYHESHDEAGNSDGSKRTIEVALNSAPVVGENRRYAEARCRFAFGIAMLSAGTPMFFMGEEIGAQKLYKYIGAKSIDAEKPDKYINFMKNREDLFGERQADGQRLFRFYQDMIRLRLSHSGLRTSNIDIVHIHNANRVIAFQRWDDNEELFVVASLNNHPFNLGYDIESPKLTDGFWREIFNSDDSSYGGNNVGNLETTIPVINKRINVVIPSNGVVVFQKVLRFS